MNTYVWIGNGKKTSFVILLIFTTIAAYNFIEQYKTVGPELLVDTGSTDWNSAWTRTAKGTKLHEDYVQLQNNDPRALVQIKQSLIVPQNGTKLVFSADISTTQAVGGESHWESARLVLISHNKQGNALYYIPHTLVDIRGNHDWEHHSKVFLIPEEASTMTASVQLMHTTGTMRVRGISLRRVEEKANFTILRWTLLTLWGLYSIWLLPSIMQQLWGKQRRVLTISFALLILAGVSLPPVANNLINRNLSSSMFHAKYKKPISTIKESAEPAVRINVHKLGHFVLFVLLAVSLTFQRKEHKQIGQLLLFLLLFAASTETLQLFIDGRETRLSDFIIDAAGIISGMTLAHIWRHHSTK